MHLNKLLSVWLAQGCKHSFAETKKEISYTFLNSYTIQYQII